MTDKRFRLHKWVEKCLAEFNWFVLLVSHGLFVLFPSKLVLVYVPSVIFVMQSSVFGIVVWLILIYWLVILDLQLETCCWWQLPRCVCCSADEQCFTFVVPIWYLVWNYVPVVVSSLSTTNWNTKDYWALNFTFTVLDNILILLRSSIAYEFLIA